MPARSCARFENGSLAMFESTRYARGHKALYTFEINGADASIAWDLHDLHRLSYFDHRDESIVRGWRSVHVTDGDMPYMDHWWVPGLQIGYEHTFVHQVADFLDNARREQAHVAHLPRSARNPKSVRRRARQREERPVGEREIVACDVICNVKRDSSPQRHDGHDENELFIVFVVLVVSLW